MVKKLTQKVLSGIGGGILTGLVAVTPIKAEMTDAQAKIILKESIKNPDNCQGDLNCYKGKLNEIQKVVNHFNEQYKDSKESYEASPSIEGAMNMVDYEIGANISKEVQTTLLRQYEDTKALKMLEKISNSKEKDFKWTKWPDSSQ